MTRTMLALVSAITLVACSESGSNQSSSQVMPNEASNAAAADEARTFIKSHFSVHHRSRTETAADGSTSLSTDDEKTTEIVLNDDLWSWHIVGSGSSEGKGIKVANSTDFRYQFKPSEIALPLTVGKDEYYSIRFECTSGKCIKLMGSIETSITPDLGVNRGRQPADSQLEKVYWNFDNAEDAERVSKAATFLLEQAGAKKSRF